MACKFQVVCSCWLTTQNTMHLLLHNNTHMKCHFVYLCTYIFSFYPPALMCIVAAIVGRLTSSYLLKGSEISSGAGTPGIIHQYNTWNQFRFLCSSDVQVFYTSSLSYWSMISHFFTHHLEAFPKNPIPPKTANHIKYQHIFRAWPCFMGKMVVPLGWYP